MPANSAGSTEPGHPSIAPLKPHSPVPGELVEQVSQSRRVAPDERDPDHRVRIRERASLQVVLPPGPIDPGLATLPQSRELHCCFVGFGGGGSTDRPGRERPATARLAGPGSPARRGLRVRSAPGLGDGRFDDLSRQPARVVIAEPLRDRQRGLPVLLGQRQGGGSEIPGTHPGAKPLGEIARRVDSASALTKSPARDGTGLLGELPSERSPGGLRVAECPLAHQVGAGIRVAACPDRSERPLRVDLHPAGEREPPPAPAVELRQTADLFDDGGDLGLVVGRGRPLPDRPVGRRAGGRFGGIRCYVRAKPQEQPTDERQRRHGQSAKLSARSADRFLFTLPERLHWVSCSGNGQDWQPESSPRQKSS